MRPRGFDWDEFQTLKVKVGVHQTWGTDNDGLSLNFKANTRRQYPGVEYVLCVHISPSLEVRAEEYRLYRLDSIVNGELGTPRMDVTPIDRNSVVVFDAHRLLEFPPDLGLVPPDQSSQDRRNLQGDADLPAGFYDPVTIDLVELVRGEFKHIRGVNERAERPGTTVVATVVG
ncbi:hypothetical protein PRNP1_004613 [Phytophthora ramorum]